MVPELNLSGCVMRKYFGIILLGIVTGFWTAEASAQQITLTGVPYQLITESDAVTITWLEPIQATLHYGTTHGSYTKSISKSGTQSLTFVPQDEGIQPGFYYGIITNGSLKSEEFPFIIEAPASPIMRKPENNTTVQTATPEFQWDEVSGVPFYHLILSDHEAVISRDENGNLQLSGANIIWQVITPETHITYGDPDPSGYFSDFNGTTPPLLNGNHYTWIVLNNYGNNPAFTSIVQSGVSAFDVDLNLSVAAPTLIFPANNAALHSKTITFQWQSVSGAANYQISLFEYIYQEGSSSSFLIWSATTSNTSIELPARSILKGTHYSWRVLAMDNSGNGTPSEIRDFIYEVPISALSISTFQTNGKRLPRTNVTISAIDGTSDNVSFITSDNGYFTASVRPGSYAITASKEGFLDTTKTVQVEGGDTLSVAIRLRPASHRVSGIAKDQSNQPLPAVSVRAKDNSSGRILETASDADGHFVLSLATGLWDVWGQKENYSNSDTIRIELGSTKEVTLAQPLILKEFNAFIHGKVINANDQPVITAKVRAQKGEKIVSQFTANNGTFNLQVSSGEWVVTVTKGGYVSPAPRVVQVTPGSTVEISPDLRLTPGAGILTGFVFSGQNSVRGAEVKAVPPSGSSYSAFTDPKGAYLLNVPAGDYTVTVSKQGYAAPTPLQISLGARETISNLNFSLQENPVFISGKTTSNGYPLEGAIVQTNGAADTSLADGSYKLWVQPGTYRIEAAKPGFAADQVQTVTIGLGESKTGIDFTLTPNSGTIKGNVHRGNLPLVGALVLAISGSDTFQTSTDDQGNYAISLKSGAWTIHAVKSGFIPGQINTAVQSGQTITGVDFDLTPNIGTIVGHIRDNRGQAISAATIRVVGRALQAMTHLSGDYSIQLEPGTYQLKAFKEGYGIQTASVSVSLNSTVTRNFSLTTMGTLTGKITDSSNGSPVSKAPVWAISGSDTFETHSDYTGEYTLFLNSGTYSLYADQLGYHQRQVSVTITAGAIRVQNMALSPAPEEIAGVSGRILDDFNKPMAGVPISLFGGKVDLIYTETNGTYSIKKLQTGLNYSLRPKLAGFFFVPEKRVYKPLTANQSNQNFSAALYGDVSGNKEISSFDGSLILRISAQQNVTPYFTNQPRDSIAADVSGNGQVSSFDASLIFRYSVHLISRFPAEPSRLGKILQIYSDPVTHIFTFGVKHLQKNRWAVDIRSDNLNHVIATQWKFHIDPQWLIVKDCSLLTGLADHRLAWSEKNGTLSISTAGTRPAKGGGEAIRILVEVKGDPSISPDHFIRVERLEVNEGLVAAEFQAPEPTQLPAEFHLYDNYPNPFNGETQIRFALPGNGDKKLRFTELSIYNVLGQKIKDLVRKELPPGYYQFKWNGRDESGNSVTGGVYFYRLKTGNFARVKKLLILK